MATTVEFVARLAVPTPCELPVASLGRVDDAFALLERGYEERASFMGGAKTNAAFVPLRGDFRWTRLLAKMSQ